LRQALGDTPLKHLCMQKAMQLLASTEQSLEQIASAVGYQDAFGFSKVFKRSTGQAPCALRLQKAQESEVPWRLQANAMH